MEHASLRVLAATSAHDAGLVDQRRHIVSPCCTGEAEREFALSQSTRFVPRVRRACTTSNTFANRARRNYGAWLNTGSGSYIIIAERGRHALCEALCNSTRSNAPSRTSMVLTAQNGLPLSTGQRLSRAGLSSGSSSIASVVICSSQEPTDLLNTLRGRCNVDGVLHASEMQHDVLLRDTTAARASGQLGEKAVTAHQLHAMTSCH
eukprot:113760-Prymnesium_polylepis.1